MQKFNVNRKDFLPYFNPDLVEDGINLEEYNILTFIHHKSKTAGYMVYKKNDTPNGKTINYIPYGEAIKYFSTNN